MDIEMAQEIETQKTSCRNVRRQAVSANFNILSFDSPYLERRNGKKRDVFNSTGSGNRFFVEWWLSREGTVS